jgi:hypothetical protein
MEQKTTKQRTKSLVTKNESPMTKNEDMLKNQMVLKAETVLEVKNKKQVSKKNEVVESNTTQVQSTSTQAQTTKQAQATKQAQTTAQAQATTQNVSSKKNKLTTSTNTQQTDKKAQIQEAGSKTTKKTATPVQEVVSKTTKKTAKSVQEAGSKATKKTATPVQEAGSKATKKTVRAKAPKVNEEVALDEPSKALDDKLRYFKLYYNDNICGRYSGKKPKQAANKAFSSIIKEMKKTDNNEGVNVDITFTIKECTRNSFHKEYKYIGKRLLLKAPVKVRIENEDGTSKDIVYKYHNELKKAPKV